MTLNTTRKVASIEKVNLWEGADQGLDLVRIRTGFRIFLDNRYRDYVDETYETFLALARAFSPSALQLTDDETVSQLQDLYFLLKEGILKVTESDSPDGSYSLLLEILED
jgi:hypothetical protein